MLSVGIYKRTQGRRARQATFFALAVAIGLGVLRLGSMLNNSNLYVQYGVPSVLLIAAVWVCYRLVNVPAFADFLIAVEAEMNKVSWPSRPELLRASLVVVVAIFALAFILAGYDFAWAFLFRNILHIL